ncbi:MAG: UDP-N-acetylglucosamine 2-epimerase (non-hydrolyzing) [Bacteroidales bacterium]|jgi:UDP-GlcNAc3NAcA epimerase|nr:UDP-N-acetylglucosamine 2-epimerase (non-hydrolyzing) [Bacteroidales bacterium]
MTKLITIIGARPQIIKASALSRAIRNHFSDKIEEVIVHTGQHYDANMSDVFFTELDIPKPKYNLAVGSGSHGVQTSKMIEGIEDIILREQPDAIVLYGDTNSTLAGAIAASKLHLPVVHIEAGLRSFDKNMPEEVNRIMCDHVSTLLFSPTKTGYNNLLREGFSPQITERPTYNNPNVYHCGDIMYDNTIFFLQKADAKYANQNPYGQNFILCTIHRDTNTDNPHRLNSIFQAIEQLSQIRKVILPLHPRTRKMLPQMLDKDLLQRLNSNVNINIIEPLSFLEMTFMESKSGIIITDSGGVQKEAYYLKKPCVILRPQTEWIEIVRNGNATIADANCEKIISLAQNYINNPPKDYPEIFGDGNAAKFMCEEIVKCCS